MPVNRSLISPTSNTLLERALREKLLRRAEATGSLGELEPLAVRLGLMQNTLKPRFRDPQLVIFAADHGLAVDGLMAPQRRQTREQVQQLLSGALPAAVFARIQGLEMSVVDCGVAKPFAPRDAAPGAPQLLLRKVAPGTADASVGPAMTAEQCAQAITNGIEVVRALPGNALLLGEMGIANTSVASLLLARLAGLPLADVTGAGTGLDAAGIERKRAVLQQALDANAEATTPLAALAALGGYEVATLVGAVLQAALERRVIVVDGFITSAAVLVASRLQPAVLQRCVFAHRSGERGHSLMLAQMQAEPLLDLGLRLGEGSGAALAWPLLQSSCAVLAEMASFESAGVATQTA